VRLLLDTHVLLWALGDVDRLSPAAREAIADPDNEVFVSAVTGWEIGIKSALGKLRVPADLPEQIAAARFTTLSMTFDDGIAAGTLPRHHDDPFDRMLVVQAMARQLLLVTADARIEDYDVECLRAGLA
jgi:PIN domain nuclease of toxin-antitoxin system